MFYTISSFGAYARTVRCGGSRKPLRRKRKSKLAQTVALALSSSSSPKNAIKATTTHTREPSSIKVCRFRISQAPHSRSLHLHPPPSSLMFGGFVAGGGNRQRKRGERRVKENEELETAADGVKRFSPFIFFSPHDPEILTFFICLSDKIRTLNLSNFCSAAIVFDLTTPLPTF